MHESQNKKERTDSPDQKKKKEYTISQKSRKGRLTYNDNRLAVA